MVTRMLTIRVAIMCSFFAAVAGTAPKHDIRDVDFRNFAYPWNYHGSPSRLEWMSTSESNEVRLRDGKWQDSENQSDSNDPPALFSGLTLESIIYSHLSDRSQEQAIVVLRYDSGGTQYSYFVYIYSMQASVAKVLAYFHAGDRADFGLYRVYADDGKLVVELFDPSKRIGDCCSNGFVRTKWRWRQTKFEMAGPTEFGTPTSQSRLPVSTFGTHG
jgi:hypothetical protein